MASKNTINTRSNKKQNKSQSETEDEAEGITLEFVFNQLKNSNSELSLQIINMKADILAEFKMESETLIKELKAVKEELTVKSNLIAELQEEIESLKDNQVGRRGHEDLERDIAEVQQYVRRNNIEICGIPDEITTDKLEDTVISIAKAANVVIRKGDIEACHRLFKKPSQVGPKKTIVRFVNRKMCEALLRKNKSFSQRTTIEKTGLKGKIYINNNLCGYYKMLWGKAKSLYTSESIEKFWVYNGTVNIKRFDENDPIKITHFNDLYELFPNSNLLQ